jgi:hypothetical protein
MSANLLKGSGFHCSAIRLPMNPLYSPCAMESIVALGFGTGRQKMTLDNTPQHFAAYVSTGLLLSP